MPIPENSVLKLVKHADTTTEILGTPPDVTSISVRKVRQGIADGWIKGTGEKIVQRPSGPADDPTLDLHTFVHYSTLTIGGVKYTVTHQPDKYAADGADDTPVTSDVYAAGDTRVDHFYVLELKG